MKEVYKSLEAIGIRKKKIGKTFAITQKILGESHEYPNTPENGDFPGATEALSTAGEKSS